MKKRVSFPVLFVVSTALALGFANARINNNSLSVEAVSQVNSQISSVQVRSGGSGANYLVILDSNIDPTSSYATMSGSKYNAPDYVNIYMEPHGTAIPLSSIIDSGANWTLNLWSSGGIMFPISDALYETYNGSTIYAIEILEGCTYPDNNFNKVYVTESCKFTNNSYGDSSAKNEAFFWSKIEYLVPSDITINITAGQTRADAENNFYNICLCSDVFNGVDVIDYNDLSEINAYNKIKLFLSDSDTGHYLSEITSLRTGTQNRWSSATFLFNLTAAEYELYNGTTIFKMVVEAGCQVVLNRQIVTIPTSYELFNNNYGNPAYKYEVCFLEQVITPLNPIDIIDAQVRADAPNNFYFIDVRADEYTNTPVIEYNNFGDLNTYSHIKIYLNGSDTGTLLQDVTSLRSGYQNLWTSAAMLFALTSEEYETYNGTTIYKIEVLEGCELYINNQVRVVSGHFAYINTEWGLASAKYEAFHFIPETEDLEKLGNAELSGIHNRMDKDSGFRWLLFVFSEEIFSVYMNVTSWMEKVNLLDNVLIYLENDGEPLTLRQIYDPDTDGVTLQIFGARNVLGVSISNEKVGEKYKYGGPEMYRITIKENTKIPNQEEGVDGYRLIEKEISFINTDYGKYGEIPGAFDENNNPRLYEEWCINFTVEVAGLVSLGDIGISTVHNRMDKDSGYRWLMIFLDDAIYDVSLNVSDWSRKVNLLDNIFIYLTEDGEPITLRSIYDPTTTGITLQLFGQKTMLAVSISNRKANDQYEYCGPNMYKVVIEAGTQIPTYEKGIAGFRTVTAKTVLVNDEYNMYGEIDDTMDDYGNPRLYEEWNTKWSLASCLVSFKVVGVEGVTFPDMLLDYGQRVSLSKFAIEGYELKATTDEGETIYECIIGSNHNMNVILTYSPKDGGGEKDNEEKVTFLTKLRNFFKKIGDAFRRLFGGKSSSDVKFINFMEKGE